MSYKKVYYDEMWTVATSGKRLAVDWNAELVDIQNKIESFIDTSEFKGVAANNIKNYLSEIHLSLLVLLQSICTAYAVQAADYYGGYINRVDAGDSDTGRYTTIVFDELHSSGSIQSNINSIKKKTEDIAASALQVKNQIASIVRLSSFPKTSGFIDALNKASSKVKTLHEAVLNYESNHANDFDNIDCLLNHARSIISRQLSANRVPVASYQQGYISTMCDMQDIYNNLNALGEKITELENSPDFEKSLEIVDNREAMIAEEEQESREWVKWVAIGVAIVGAIVLTAVTAGGASVAMCAVVGGVTGIATSATSQFADNYVKNGSLTEGMDWSEFGKGCFVGAVTGAVSGGFGAAAKIGSAIKAPVKYALSSAGRTLAIEGSGAVADTVWDVGEAIVTQGPKDIMEIIGENLNEHGKSMLSKTASSFAEDLVLGRLNIKPPKTGAAGVLQNLGKESAKNITGAFTEEAVETTWEVIGEAVTSKDGEADYQSIIKDGFDDFVVKFTQDEAGSVFSTVIADPAKTKINDKIGSNSTSDKYFKTGTDIFADVGEGFVSEGGEAIAKEILDEDYDFELDDYIRDSVESSSTKVAEDLVYGTQYDSKAEANLLAKDYDNDGKVELVVFDKYCVLKEDYEAAIANAHKGSYKNMSAQDILGLPKNTAITKKYIKTQVVDIDKIQESTYKGRKKSNVSRYEIIDSNE